MNSTSSWFNSEMESAFGELLSLVCESLRCRSARIMTLNEGRLATRHSHGTLDLTPTLFWQKVLLSGEPFEASGGNQFFYGLPLRGPDGVIQGVLSLHDDGLRVFSGADKARAQSFAVVAESLLRSGDQTSRAMREELRQAEKARMAAAAREAAALESARIKGEFLANMSHEIRTPLNGIIGMAEVLQHSGLNESQSEYVKVLLDTSEILIALINDILDMAKIEAGEIELYRQSTDLCALIESVNRTHKIQADQKGIELTFTMDEKAPRVVDVDGLRLRQILNNLIGNAIKFTDHGQVDVTAQWLPYGAFRVSVHDTGIGIETEVQDRLFKNFTQGDASITKRFGGTGLGLAISKKLVELMKGRIGMMSTPGEGSEFWFEIPCPISPSAASWVEEDSAEVCQLPPQKRLLLVEDNEVNRRVVMSYLPEGLQVDIAANGSEAYEKVQANAYDLILMDCQMPVMDGLEATRLIRSLEQLSETHIPIIAITANAMPGDRELCLSSGMDDYLAKPLKKKVLLERIEHWLTRK